MDAKSKLNRLCEPAALLLAGVALFLQTSASQADPDDFAGNFNTQLRSTGLPVAPVRIVINIFDPEEQRPPRQHHWSPHGIDQGGLYRVGNIPAFAAQDDGLAFPLVGEDIFLSVKGLHALLNQEQGSLLPPSFTQILNKPSSPNGLTLEFSRMRFKGLSYAKGNVKVTMTGRLKKLVEFRWQVE